MESGGEAVTYTVVREGLSVEVAFEQGPNEMREAESIWGKGIPGSEDSKCKGPEVELNLPCLQNKQEAS